LKKEHDMWAGANIEEMSRLADQLDAGAQMITSGIADMERAFGAMWWQGSDATQFSNQWDGNHAPGLRALADSCRAEAAEVRRQRDQQIAVAQAAAVAAQQLAAAQAAAADQQAQVLSQQGQPVGPSAVLVTEGAP
jgi:hypothetical protein